METLELIKTLPPEIREIIYKEFLTIKLRQRKALGWHKVHEQILKLPFCHNRQQIVRMIIAELQRAKRASGAPLVRKFGKPPSRENLVIT